MLSRQGDLRRAGGQLPGAGRGTAGVRVVVRGPVVAALVMTALRTVSAKRAGLPFRLCDDTMRVTPAHRFRLTNRAVTAIRVYRSADFRQKPRPSAI